MSRLVISYSNQRFSRPSRYESRLRKIGGIDSAALSESAPLFPPLLLRIMATLAVAAVVAVSLAIWRIYHFPH